MCVRVCVGMRVGVFVLADVSLFPLCRWTERGRGGQNSSSFRQRIQLPDTLCTLHQHHMDTVPGASNF